jgi:RNA polymerase sigma factor (sigma-70 family)
MIYDISNLVESLTPREKELLNLLVAEGLSNNKIAERLYISKWTVERHLSNIYGKLGVESRAEAIAWVNQQRAMQLKDS